MFYLEMRNRLDLIQPTVPNFLGILGVKGLGEARGSLV